MSGTPANGALLAGALLFQVVSLAMVVWWHLRRGLPRVPSTLGREVSLITTVVFLAFVGGAVAAMAAMQGRATGRVVWPAALTGGSVVGYAVLALMLKRIFHLEEKRSFGLAARIGLTTLFIWVVVNFAAQMAARLLAGR